MDYKVLIKLYVPEIEEEYEMFIPINKEIGEVAQLLAGVVSDLSKLYPKEKNAFICNRLSGIIYERSLLVRDSDIKNGSQLVLF